MNDKHRIYLANLVAPLMVWAIFYLYLSTEMQNCSGRHCLGYGSLLAIFLFLLIISSITFSVRAKITIPKCYSETGINFTCLIKKPVIISTCLSVIFFSWVLYNAKESVFSSPTELLIILSLTTIPAIITTCYLSIWYFIVGRHNKAFKRDSA